MKQKEMAAILLALFTCLIWSGNFVLARGVHEWMPPVTLAFWRWTTAFVFLFVFKYSVLFKEWPIILQNKWYLLAMGVFGVATFNTLVYTAAHYTSAQHIALISAAAPVGTLVFAGLLGIERLSRYKVGGGICAFVGAMIVITHGNIFEITNQSWNYGDMLLVVTALIWAAWGVALTFKPKELSTSAFLLVIMAVGALCLAPFYAWEAVYVMPTPFSAEAWAVYLYTGVLSSAVGWFLWQHSVETVGAIKTSLLYYSLPIFSVLLAVVFLDEKVQLYHVAGFLMVFAGIVISNLRKLGIIKKTDG